MQNANSHVIKHRFKHLKKSSFKKYHKVDLKILLPVKSQEPLSAENFVHVILLNRLNALLVNIYLTVPVRKYAVARIFTLFIESLHVRTSP